MIVEPYDFTFPFQLTASKLSYKGKQLCVQRRTWARELAIRLVFNKKETVRSELGIPLAVMPCQGFDVKVDVATEFRALARRAGVASARRPSRNL